MSKEKRLLADEVYSEAKMMEFLDATEDELKDLRDSGLPYINMIDEKCRVYLMSDLESYALAQQGT